MSRLKSTDAAISRANQNSYLDQIISGHFHDEYSSSTTHHTALSLKCDETVAFGCICGNRSAKAIRDSWRFKEPVTVMEAATFDSLVERVHMTFVGREGGANE